MPSIKSLLVLFAITGLVSVAGADVTPFRTDDWQQ